LFVLSSDYEGISNAMLEALAMGIPSVCTDCPVGGARRYLKPNHCSFLVPTGDLVSFSAALAELMALPRGTTDFFRAQKLRDELSIRAIVHQWEQVL